MKQPTFVETRRWPKKIISIKTTKLELFKTSFYGAMSLVPTAEARTAEARTKGVRITKEVQNL